VGRETKGRRGSGVTVLTGLPLPEVDLRALATRLKQKCGAGGTVKEGVIEIQGDHRDAIVAELAALGWAAKRSGG
jgi:translation initiation factor 1